MATEDRWKRLRAFCERYSSGPLPEDFPDVVGAQLDIDLSARYGPFCLKNPLLVAPGQLTVSIRQISAIRAAGYAGCALKSVVGEDASGGCSMQFQRKRPTFIRRVYDPRDRAKQEPIIHWDGRLDIRDFPAYMAFARAAAAVSDRTFPVAASLLCHLPAPNEDVRKEEWTHAAGCLTAAGYRLLEIDFCPFLQAEDLLEDKENILRWYRDIPRLLKRAFPAVAVYPKILNAGLGLEFQMEMAGAARSGGADGVVIANRMFRRDLGYAHGGRELRDLNLLQVREAKRAFRDFPVSATGGVYTGRQMRDYLSAGAENVQVLSAIMGESDPGRIREVFRRIFLDPRQGYLAAELGPPA